MSRSYKKSGNNKYGFCCWACYFSNKKDKRLANRKFRTISKRWIKKMKSFNDIDDSNNVYKLKEVSNTWNFSSDGLAQYIRFNESWTNDDIRKINGK